MSNILITKQKILSDNIKYLKGYTENRGEDIPEDSIFIKVEEWDHHKDIAEQSCPQRIRAFTILRGFSLALKEYVELHIKIGNKFGHGKEKQNKIRRYFAGY